MLNLSNARNRLAQALMALRMDSWARHVELTAVEAGLRIEVQDSTDGQLFLRGGARLNPAARPTMAAIAEELGILPNSLVIEGHTDAMPYSRNGGLYTNWEVSTDRANTARRFLVEHGVRPEQVVEVRGYADRRLRIWHDPYNPRNRRISILVLLERRQPTAAPAPDAQSPAHPLLERLNQLEYAAQGPGRTAIELQPNGKAYPGTSAQEAPRAPAGEGSRAVLDPHAASTESPLESE
jgi:outer membrane protein OmpA-like peptidoglycan-associated protein